MKTKELLQKFLDDAREDNILGPNMYEALNRRVYFYTEVVFDENSRVNETETSQEQALNLADVNQRSEQLAIAALNKIAHPIKYLQDEAEKDGCRLDGYMAIQLTKDASFYQEIALKALKAIADCG